MIIHLRTAQGKRILWPAWHRPRISPKSTLLVIMSLIASGYIFVTLDFHISLRLAIVDLVSFPLSWIVVFILNAPTMVYHKIVIARAISMLRKHKSMQVIGITGSYGKTSTKEYLATILASKFQVLKTEASKNSPIGIAEVILKSLKPKHEVFVVEMGAYKRKEIKEMAAMVRPQIGIITAINEQHQDLFGTMENTMKAKYELIEGLEGKRIAIMNIDNARVRTMAEWATRDGREVWGVTKEISKSKYQIANKYKKTYSAIDITASFDGVEFTCASEKEQFQVKVPVLGAHQASNLLAAIAGAMAAGMTMAEAVKGANKITLNPKSLSMIPGINGSISINDTFNNSPDSARAALDVLAWGKAKKILVFQPMIELGAFAKESHISIGSYAARICDEVILTNQNFYDDFMKGVRSQSESLRVEVLSAQKARARLRMILSARDAVLFKGKEAGNVLQAMKI